MLTTSIATPRPDRADITARVTRSSAVERQASPEWAPRYARRAENDRLPTGQAARDALALTFGGDGYALLIALYAATAPMWLREVPAVDTLRRVWMQQYHLVEGAVQWRAAEEIPPATTIISSPHDLDAHYAKKRTTRWVGYKVHITETCEDDLPHLVTQVETMAGPIADGDATQAIHDNLARRDLLPRTTSSIPATSMPSCWSPADTTTPLTCSALRDRTCIGRHAPGRASPFNTSVWTGRGSGQPAPKAGQASAGRPRWTIATRT